MLVPSAPPFEIHQDEGALPQPTVKNRVARLALYFYRIWRRTRNDLQDPREAASLLRLSKFD